MASNSSTLLRDLLLTTKDGDWGNDEPKPGYVPFRVIRGADFPEARVGNLSSVPVCYLDETTVHRRTLEPLDIIIETAGGNRDRPTGRTLLVTDQIVSRLGPRTTCASFCRFLRVNRDLADPRYVYWYLQYLYSLGTMWIHQVQHTGVARFQYTKFAESTAIPLPTRTQQERIAEILGSLDNKIELNRHLTETLKAVARALFKSWFMDFDPVHAKAAGKKLEGLDSSAVSLFPDSFQDSPLGKIPMGWRIGGLNELADVIMGSSPPGDTYNESAIGTPLVNGPVEFGDYYTVRKKWTTAPQRLSHSGDLIFCVRGSTTGKRVIADGVYCLGRGVCAIRSKSSSNGFIYALIECNLDRLLSKVNGSVFPNLNGPDIKEFEVLIPPSEIILAYQKIVEPLHGLIGHNVRESSTLSGIRDALLPKLLSGDL